MAKQLKFHDEARRALERAQHRGRAAHVHLQVRDGNANAFRLYRDLGMTIISREVD